MPASPSPPKQAVRFLLDENVKKRLAALLASRGFDTKTAPKGVSDTALAELSKSERRVLVTNDSDLLLFPKESVFSVVLLEVPQDRPEALLKSFSLLLKEKSVEDDFEGLLIRLEEERRESSPISPTAKPE